jgi:methylated-DNA-[protein]-cysteine S-methyltransferase
MEATPFSVTFWKPKALSLKDETDLNWSGFDGSARSRCGMKVTQPLFVEQMDTPVGVMLVVTDAEDVLRAVGWHDYEDLMHTLLRRQYRHATFAIEAHPSRSSAARALKAYFDGDLKAVDGLSVVTGGADFQRRVWAALRGIPAGETISYSVLAVRIGQPTAVRAVGHANGANLIDIVVPCHRVVGANRSLTGYGGGLERKRWLLDHERKWQAGSA